MTRKLTPAQLDEIEAATIRKQVVHAAVNGEPDKRFATVLALIAEVRELRAKVERVRELHNADGERMTGSPRATGWEDYCTHCQRAAPCPTVRALDLFKALGEEA